MGRIVFPTGVVLKFTPDAAASTDKFLLQDSVDKSIVAYSSIPVDRLTALTPSKIVVTDINGFISTAGATDISLTELNHLNGVTSNIQVQLDSKQTASEFDPDIVIISDGSGDLDSSAVTATELSHLSGVTSPIQTQLNGKQATITGGASSITSVDLTLNRALISSGTGKVAVSTVTATELGYVNGVLSPIQLQLDTKLTANIVAPQVGNVLYYTGSTWSNFPNGTTGQVLGFNGSSLEWVSPSVNGLPAGGTTAQFLRKNSGTNYDASWHTFVAADISDITATAANIDILAGTTVTNTEFNYLSGVGSNIQVQLDNKLHRGLAYNALWVGDPGNLPVQMQTGNDGTVLTSVNGAPVWQTPTPPGNVSGVAPSTDHALVRWNGTAADSIQNSAVILDDSNNMSGVATLSTGQVSVLNQAAIRLYETGSTNYVAIRASGTMAADYTITLPDAAPTSNTALTYDGANYVWSASGGSTTFIALTDTDPTTYVGQAGKIVRVNAGETGLEFFTLGAGGTVTSVTGTAGRIVITGTPTVAPVVNIDPAYVGQNTITTLGTVATGTWNATNISLAKGGTGASLVDPNADRIFFWDDSAGSTAFLTPGTSLAITTTTIDVADGGITDLKLRDSSGLSVIGRSVNSSGDPADIVAGTDAHVLRRSGTTLGFGTIGLPSITMNTARILGRLSGGVGAVEEIQVGNGLSFAGGAIDLGDASLTGSVSFAGAGSFNYNVGGFDVTSSSTLSLTAGTSQFQILNNSGQAIQLGATGGMVLNLGSDNAGDIYYRNGSARFTRLPIGSSGQYLSVASGFPVWTNDVIEDVTGTIYNAVSDDNGKIKHFTNVAGCTVSIPVGMPNGWSVVLYRGNNAGTITITSGGTYEGAANTIEVEMTAATIYHRGSNIHVGLGSLGTPSGGGGSGTVTSVGLTAPSILSVSGSPIVTSGTIALSLATQAANTVFAGPAVGPASAAPTFRSIVLADLPNETIETVSGTTYTFLESDNKKIKHFTHASGCTITIPLGLSTGWVSTAYRGSSTGTLTFGSAGTYEGESNTLATQETAATIIHRGGDFHMALGAFGSTGGTGTVTSVGLSVPSFLSVSGSPVTTAGTIAVSLSGTALPTTSGGTGLTTLGTANQILGMNNAGTGLEYKTVSVSNTAVSNDVGVTMGGANAFVINLPDAALTVRGLLTASTQTIGGVKTFFQNPVFFPTSATQVHFAGTSGVLQTSNNFTYSDSTKILGISSNALNSNLGFGVTNTNGGATAGSRLTLSNATSSGSLTLTSPAASPVSELILTGNGTGGVRIEASGSAAPIKFFTGAVSAERGRFNETGLGIGLTSPSALLHLAAGTTTVAPAKLTSGTALAATQDGALEYHGSHLWFTIGSTRYQLDQQTGGGGGSGTVTSFSAGNLTPLFTTSVTTATTTPALSFTLSNAAANTYFGNAGAAPAAPSFTSNAALTVGTNDTNITLSVGSNASTALLKAATVSVAWAGTLAATRGGTGTATVTTGDLLYGSGSNVWSKLAAAAAGNVLISGSTPSWGKVALTTHVSGVLPIANGGTNLSAIGTALQVLRVNAGGTALEYATIGAGLTNNALNTELTMSGGVGTNLSSSGVFSPSHGDINLGSDAGTDRFVQATGSGSNIVMRVIPKGTGNVQLETTTGSVLVGDPLATGNRVLAIGSSSATADLTINAKGAAGIIELGSQSTGFVRIGSTTATGGRFIDTGSSDTNAKLTISPKGTGDLELGVSTGTLLIGSTSATGNRIVSIGSSSTDANLTINSKGTGGLLLNNRTSGYIQIGDDTSTTTSAIYITTSFDNDSVKFTGRAGISGAIHGSDIHIVGGNGFTAGKGGNICLQGGSSNSALGGGNVILHKVADAADDYKGAERVLIIPNRDVAPSSGIGDSVAIYAQDSSVGSTNSTLALFTEQAVEAIGTFTASHKLRIWINGVEYHIQLDAV